MTYQAIIVRVAIVAAQGGRRILGQQRQAAQYKRDQSVSHRLLLCLDGTSGFRSLNKIVQNAKIETVVHLTWRKACFPNSEKCWSPTAARSRCASCVRCVK